MICGSCCSKSWLVKAAGAEVAAERSYEKLHAAVARSTFVRQNVQNTAGSEPFWKLRSGKMARRCGAKHICTSKCTKHLMVGAILEVAIRKNGTPLWREAHLYVKMYKAPHGRSHFGSCDPEKWHAAVARSTFVRQNLKKLTGSDHFLKVRFRKNARGCGAKHIFNSKCTKHLMLGPLFEAQMSKKSLTNSLTN